MDIHRGADSLGVEKKNRNQAIGSGKKVDGRIVERSAR